MKRWFVVFAFGVLGCGGSGASGASCPTGSTLTYDNFGRAFFASYCDSCHVSRERPTLSSLGEIRAQRTAIDREAAAGADAVNTTMPEGSNRPTEAERRRLGEWLACGAP